MTEKLKSRRWKIILNVVTILALLGLGYAMRDQIADTFDNLGRVNLWVLLLMIPAQAVNYVAQANFYQSMFRVVGERFRLKSMLRLVLELNFVNTVFPSGGVSGFSYLAIRLKDEKVSTAKATLVQMLRFIFIFISVQILLFVGLVALAIGGRANDFALLLAGILGTLITVATMLTAYIVGSKSRINAFFVFFTKLANWLIHLVRPKHPETINVSRAKRAFNELNEIFLEVQSDKGKLRRPLVFAVLSVAAEVATIYVVYVAFGLWVNVGAVILAYAVANFAGLVAILPGGIGIYEALMTAVLTAGGIPAVISLPVTIMYRILNMGIGLPIGFYFYQHALHAEPAIADKVEHDVEEQKEHERIGPERL
jgi:uncharacterized protein (TIRG00374 family)